ncbi:MAG: UDP-N-acetylmuramoyl-tripeptide--D-alanyl-D-alanine ligase, partial [Actinomycetota bacterium]
MTTLTTADVLRVVRGARQLGPDATASKGVVADSRATTPGVAFAAINTGTAFIADALKGGASFVITSDASSVPDGSSAVVVDDMQSALMAVATDVVRRLNPRVVGVTGSVGKTLTKDLIAAALKIGYRVRATPRSFNAEIGVPLTIMGAPDDVEVLVIEMGARGVGQIAELCEIARPHTGAITTIGTTHLEVFGTREAIARTKSELLAALPADGAAIVPSNDDFLATMVSWTDARAITVGPGGNVRYTATAITPDGTTLGTVSIGDVTAEVTLP